MVPYVVASVFVIAFFKTPSLFCYDKEDIV